MRSEKLTVSVIAVLTELHSHACRNKLTGIRSHEAGKMPESQDEHSIEGKPAAPVAPLA
jgi:hypothetical protein